MINSFKFSDENETKIMDILKKYPADRQQSAVMPLLHLAQHQNEGWLSQAAIETVAQRLKMPLIRVQEVATFYSMYRLKPVHKNVIHVCTTTPCWLRGSDKIMQACKASIKDDITLLEVDCLGACVGGPVVQVNDDYIENVTPESIAQIIEDLQNKKDLTS